MNQFKNKIHEEAFNELITQSEGELSVHESQDEQKRRQVALLYLIAMYQEEYERYEGMKFYVEVYEEISIDGPVYLLEDCIKLEDFAHEKILKAAKDILRGCKPHLEKLEIEDVKFVEIAYNFAVSN